MDLDPYESLKAKIGANCVRVGIIGLGYVGLPLALAFARQRLSVLGFDTDPIKVDKLGAARAISGTSPANRSAKPPASSRRRTNSGGWTSRTRS